jgi:hypothetical protein
MKMRSLSTLLLLAVVLAAGTCRAEGLQRAFGFNGSVDSFNRGGGMLVVGDLLFHISESTLVHARGGGRGTLSDITPGTRIGFYPGTDRSSIVNEIWILPKNWQGKPGYADTPDN